MDRWKLQISVEDIKGKKKVKEFPTKLTFIKVRNYTLKIYNQ